MDEDTLRRLWAETIPAGADWAGLAAEATYRPPLAASTAATVAPLGAATESLSADATLGGAGGGPAGGPVDPGAATVPPLAGSSAGDGAGGSMSSGVTFGAAPRQDRRDGGVGGSSAVSERSGLRAPASAGFEVEAEIGRGGMGVVFRARQRSLDREVAIKRILGEGASEALRERFVTEGRVTGFLDHPNIVPVHELGVGAEGELYLAMKLVGGRSWKALIAEARAALASAPGTAAADAAAASAPAPASAAAAAPAERPVPELDRHLDILSAVLNAVAFAHSRGLCHLDLKPENVMVGDFGEVLVMDWGLAVDVRDDPGEHTRTPHRSTIRGPCGTPAYMPPELAEGRGDDVGPWTDVYLAGAILHELLTGRPPHRGRTLIEVLLSASRSEPAVYPIEAPAGLADIARRALARAPKDRFGSVGELQDALRAYRAHRASDELAEVAARTLSRARERAVDAAALDATTRRALYGDLAEAGAGFRQALVLWADNAAARAGEREVRAVLARAALASGDLGLAEAEAGRLAEKDPERAPLLAAVAAARAETERAARWARTLRSTAVGLALAVFVAVTVAFFWIRAERDEADRQRGRAIAEREAAERARAEEERERVRANENERIAADRAAEALRQERDALRRLAESQVAEARGLVRADRPAEAEDRLREARLLFERLGLSTVPADLAFVEAWQKGPPALVTCARAVDQDGVTKRVERLAFLPDGKLLASALSWAAIYDPVIGRRERSFEGEPIDELAPFFDGRRGLAGRYTEPYGLAVVDLASGAIERVIETAEVAAFAASLDGSIAVVGHRTGGWFTPGDVRAYDLAADGGRGGALLATGHRVRCVAVSWDGARAASGTGGGTVFLWDLRAMREERRIDAHPQAITGLAFSPNGKALYTASEDGTIASFLVETGEQATPRIEAHVGGVSGLALRADVQRVVTGGKDGMVRLWDPWDSDRGSTRLIRSFRVGAPVTAVALSADGDRIAAADDHGWVRLWSAAERDLDGGLGMRCRPLTGGAAGLAVSPDGALLASGAQGRLCLTEIASGRFLSEYGDELGVWRTAWLPNGRQVLAAGKDGGVVVHTVVGEGAAETLRPGGVAGAGVLPVASFPDGRHAVLGAHVVELATGRELLELRTGKSLGRISAVAVSPDGLRILAGDSDGGLGLLSSASGESLKRFGGHASEVTAVAFVGPDGARAASGGKDGLVKVWDLASGSHRKLAGHAAPVAALAVSPDGAAVASGSADRTLRVWECASGRELATFGPFEGTVGGVAWTRDGRGVIWSTEAEQGGVIDLARVSEHVRIEREASAAAAALQKDPDGAGAGTPLALLARWYAVRGGLEPALDLAARAEARGARLEPLTVARWAYAAGDLARAEREYASALADPALAPLAPSLDAVLAAVRRQRGWTTSYVENGARQLRRRAWEPARDACDQAVGWSRALPAAWAGLARGEAGLGRSGALLTAGGAIARAPHDPDALAALALALRQVGAPRASAVVLERATAIDPANASLWHDAWDTWRQAGDPARAAEHASRAYDLDPEDPQRIAYRAWAREEIGDIDGALADFAAFTERSPDTLAGWIRVAALLAATGDAEGSAAAIERAHAIRPGGTTAAEVAERAEALRPLARARALEGRELTDAADLALRGRVRLRLGRYDDARRDLDRALALDPALAAREPDIFRLLRDAAEARWEWGFRLDALRRRHEAFPADGAAAADYAEDLLRSPDPGRRNPEKAGSVAKHALAVLAADAPAALRSRLEALVEAARLALPPPAPPAALDDAR